MGKIKVVQIRSIIDRPLKQKLTIDALGLGRPNWFKIHNDTPQIRGMLNKVIHLVKVEDYIPGQDAEKEIIPEKKKVRKSVKKSTEKKKSKTKVSAKKTSPKKKKAKESK
jgi:large subunit ribosomal protein L30